MRFALPFALFFVVIIFLAVGLKRDPRLLPSPLIGKPVPAFSLTALATPTRTVAGSDFAGQVYVLNVWASWCVACREEHPLLLDLASQGRVVLVGMNYKDERAAALDWLERHGDPYRVSLFDNEGRLGLDLGVYGVPETFLIDAGGVIRYKHVGPLDSATIERELLPLVVQLEPAST